MDIKISTASIRLKIRSTRQFLFSHIFGAYPANSVSDSLHELAEFSGMSDSSISIGVGRGSSLVYVMFSRADEGGACNHRLHREMLQQLTSMGGSKWAKMQDVSKSVDRIKFSIRTWPIQ